MNEKDIREYSRTLLDAFNDLTGNSINPNLDDFLKIRERSIFELNSFQKNNQKTNEIVNDNKIVNVHSNQKTNVDECENEIDDLQENKESVSTPTSKVTSKVEKHENAKEKQFDGLNNKTSNSNAEDKPTLIQNENKNVDNIINQESKNVVKNETSNNNVIGDEIDDKTDDFVFGNDEDNFNMSETRKAFDILKSLKDPWN